MALTKTFAYKTFTSYGGPFLTTSASFSIRLCKPQLTVIGPTTPCKQRLWTSPFTGFRLFPLRSPLLRESLVISFPRGTEMFHFPRLPSMTYGFSHRYLSLKR